MGERTLTYYPCPRCGADAEEWDAPSCTQFYASCSKCGWKDEREYFSITAIPEEPVQDGDVAWRGWWDEDATKYVHLGPMTRQQFQDRYPKHYAQWKEAQEQWDADAEP